MGLFLTVLARAGVVLLTVGYVVWLICTIIGDEQRKKLEKESRTSSDLEMHLRIPVRRRFNGWPWEVHLGIGLGLPVLGILWGLILTA